MNYNLRDEPVLAVTISDQKNVLAFAIQAQLGIEYNSVYSEAGRDSELTHMIAKKMGDYETE